MTDAELLAIIAQAEREGWTELDLSGNDLEGLPSEIGRLQSLERLILGRWDNKEGKRKENRLTAIPPEIFQLTNLKELHIAYNQITAIPDEIAQLSNLTNLELNSNQITAIPDAITQLSNLTNLELNSNKITAIPDAIAQLSKLQRLYLYSNKISVIPDAIAQLSNLQRLWLYSNQISLIPDAIAKLSNLQRLWLEKNQIREIPEILAQLSNLQALLLSSNQITVIPDAVANLANLKELELNSNKITAIPDAITQLSNLTNLELNSNKITAIPDAISNLANLTNLELNSNQITTIPDAISNLANLTNLELNSNQITTIPDAISNLANLTKLSLNSNQITAIPDAIAQLSNLTTLSLSSNQITAIPDAIAQLSNLTTLSLNSNQITVMPDAIIQLANLTELSLSSNQITAIPDAIESLLKLKELDLRGNKLPISPEILGSIRKVNEIFNYMRLLRSGEVQPLNEAKLLLIGQGSVGKTSLMERLIRDQYDKNQSQTDGLNVETWNVEVNSKEIRLNVWDFGGQEIYHATHQFFLTKRSLYLLVCNCRTSEEENRIEYWLKLIESFGGKSPVIIVGNKKDEQPLDINRKALREKYPNIQAIIETSCSKNEGIDELRAAILNQVGNLKEVYDLLPLSWFEVKQQLEFMPEDFITYNRYLNICHNNEISEEQNQEQLIDLLHRLGLVLNFRDHPILKDTNVLKPNWVTEGIYALLSDETLKTKTKGIFTPADLTRILDPERYPTKRHSYLVELMKEFELGFALNCHPPQFLIAGLLPKDQPDKTELQGETLEFQYHYKVLPESIISRFIVNEHDRIHNQTYWRSGVMLQYQENNETYNIARIKADPEDKKIFIAISGRKETRRLFLGILRDTFKKIHNTLPNLEITEWVPVPNHPNHPPLDYQELLGLEAMGIQEYPIGKLKINIKIRELLDGYESVESRQKTINGDQAYEDMRDIAKLAVSRTIEVKAEAKAMSQESKYTTNLQGANIANFANEVKDRARQQASNFSQTSGASVAELLQLINNLRQTTAQFPSDVQEDITIDIYDVETEIQKPEKERSLPKLKKRLLALLTAATVIATPIAGITDFANNVLEIGNKLGIELIKP